MSLSSFLQSKIPNIYWGKAPKNLSKNAIVFFPYNPNILRCGLACIVEFKQKQPEKICIFQDLYTKLSGQNSIEQISNAFLEELETQTMLQSDADFCAFAKNDKQQEYLLGIGQKLQSLIEKQEKKWTSNEKQNVILVRLRDITWRIQQEHLKNLEKIQSFLQQPLNNIPDSVLISYRRINSILNSIDRLEIRGRDSAGLVATLFLDNIHYKILDEKWKEKNLWKEYENRLQFQDLISQTIRHQIQNDQHVIHFTFKVCSEIGKLGDNACRLREIIQQDAVFQEAIFANQEPIQCLAHTRWASNGIINIYNCHPLDNAYFQNNTEHFANLTNHPLYKGEVNIYVAINGDIDNYDELKSNIEKENNFHISDKVTTDAKIIPLIVQDNIKKGASVAESFRQAVSQFQGSHAIALQTNLEPGKMYLALQGSGQAIYLGIAPERYVVASEVYGIIEDTEEYIKIEGEAPKIADQVHAQGQIYILDNTKGGLQGIQALYYDGTSLPVTQNMVQKAQIKTSDIDRQNFAYFFEKEISQSPTSILHTMRGKFDENTYQIYFDQVLSDTILQALPSKIKKIYVVGQGTASIAAQSIAYRMSETLDNYIIFGIKSSELSGFHLKDNMEDTLIIAVTQSGTTTDTNQAVDMAKKRGALSIAIVNRRNSHITSMVDSVLYTSDGRDIEVSVASTKAFYSQVVAGEILSIAIAQSIQKLTPEQSKQRLQSLMKLPELLQTLLSQKKQIQEIASKWSLTRSHWAIVGSGPNFISAQEIRIKLSELCYKSIACDFVEDKKHIDLSSEPLILVCAAGSPSAVLGDVIKDVAIFKAHNSLPIVIAQENEHRFDPYAVAVIRVPEADDLSSLILNTMAGHLFGYYTAQAIQEQSRFFASLRTSLVSRLSTHTPDEILWDPQMQNEIEYFTQEFHKRRNLGQFNSSLNPNLCTDIALLLYHATGKALPQGFSNIFQQPGSSKYLLHTLVDRLHKATEEMSRPIDAIKHQAKTVTVGTTRLETKQITFEGPIFTAFQNAGFRLELFRKDTLQRLQQIQPAIQNVLGYSYYQINNLSATGYPTDNTSIQLIRKDGIAKNMTSRSDQGPVPLMGTKRNVALTGEIFLGHGLGDKKNILIIPMYQNNTIQSHQLLLHIQYTSSIQPEQAKQILQEKYEYIKNMVIESNVPWDDNLLQKLSPEQLTENPQTITVYLTK